MENNDIMVSICCLAYNHEKYIRQCLDGFMMQKCNFKFEVLIHDDASTDHTADIIREYEKKYPGIIKPIYQTENQYSKHRGITRTIQFPRALGKYIAMCEGDDCWIDPYKLQKQFDALENNDGCGMCVGRIEKITEDGLNTDTFMPDFRIKTGVIKSYDFMKMICKKKYCFHTSTYFMQADIIKKKIVESTPDFMMVPGSLDTNLLLFFGQYGDVYYIGDVISHYRCGSIGSWSERISKMSKEEKAKGDELFIKRMNLFDEYTNQRYHDLCQDKIKYRFFNNAVVSHNYREVVKPKYFCFFKDLGFKAQAKNVLGAIFPAIIDWYDEKKPANKSQ